MRLFGGPGSCCSRPCWGSRYVDEDVPWNLIGYGCGTEFWDQSRPLVPGFATYRVSSQLHRRLLRARGRADLGILRTASALGGVDCTCADLEPALDRLDRLGWSVKESTLKNAIEAHGWIGVILSVPLFIVFWTGSVTLFYPELSRWATLPLTPPTSIDDQRPPLRSLLEEKLRELPVKPASRVTLILPGESSPMLELFVPLDRNKSKTGEDHAHLLIDPSTGRTVAEDDPFQFAYFIYELHYNLKLPQGAYIVGVVTLFFLVMLMTGIVIQFRILLRDFFRYRHEKGPRMRAHDLHTVAGVLTLPFAAMYALTGLMLNLGILFYAPAAMLAYAGDESAMMTDTGFSRPQRKWTGRAVPTPDLEPLIARVERENSAILFRLSFQNYGDESAFIRMSGLTDQGFGQRKDFYYEVATGTFPAQFNSSEPHVFRDGVTSLDALHMGKFGGPGVRFLFFVLGLGVGAMIVFGNILWLAKRQTKLREFKKIIALIRGLTVGGCTGTVVATFLGFTLERVLPLHMIARAEIVEGAFVLLLGSSVVAGFFVQCVTKFLAYSAYLSAALLGVLIISDLQTYSAQHFVAGTRDSGALPVTVGLALSAAMLLWLGRGVLRTTAWAARPNKRRASQ